MKKSLSILVFLTLLGTSIYAQRGTAEPRDACGLTYAQGYKVGFELGDSETYRGEHSQNTPVYDPVTGEYLYTNSLYLNTLERFAGCLLYTTGFREGYLEGQYNPIRDEQPVSNTTLKSIGIPEDVDNLSYNNVDSQIKKHFGQDLLDTIAQRALNKKLAQQKYNAIKAAVLEWLDDNKDPNKS